MTDNTIRVRADITDDPDAIHTDDGAQDDQNVVIPPPPAAGAAGAEVSRQASCFPAYAAAQVDRGMWKGVSFNEGGKLQSVPVPDRWASALKSGSWHPPGSPVSCTSPFRVQGLGFGI